MVSINALRILMTIVIEFHITETLCLITNTSKNSKLFKITKNKQI